MLENKKAVIFDLDGTLADSMWVWPEVDLEFLGKRNLTVPEDLADAVEGMGYTEVAVYFKDRFNLKESVEEIKEIWTEMALDCYRRRVPLKPGVKEFLAWLKEREFQIGVASSNYIGLIEAVLESHQICSYFDVILTAGDVKKGKPAPDVYLETARQLGVQPEECLVFEDICAGIRAGKAAGMDVCAVHDSFSVYQEKEKRSLADYYIHSYLEVISHQYEELR